MKIFYLSFLKARRGLVAALLVAGAAVFFAGVMMSDRPSGEPAQAVEKKPGDQVRASASSPREPVRAAAGTKPHIIYKVKTERKVAALTFDISWGTTVPGPVMDILRKYNVKSTFFLSGPWVRQHPEYPRRLIGDGHEIASHGNRHIDLDRETSATVREEITKAHQSIKEVTGAVPGLIRTPNGAYNQMVLDVADQLGYRVIQWSVDSLDWKKPGVDAIIKRVLDRVHPGAIILMHASDTCTQTPEALPRVLDGLKARGYELVTVSGLLEEGPGVAE